MKLACGRCTGVFSEGMTIEEVDGKKYHAYCASAERKERQSQQSLTAPMWTVLFFFPWLLAW